MTGFVDNIEELTLSNSNFRKVLFTGKYCQLVVMSLKPGEDIGEEVHDNVDQFFRVDAGKGKLVMEGKEYDITDGFAIVVPAGTLHNIINTSDTEDLKLYTVYAPANHPDGTIHATKAEAEEYEREHHH
jgi:mannose-6-phosphate isomerase-like protein (cupin superfamily)